MAFTPILHEISDFYWFIHNVYNYHDLYIRAGDVWKEDDQNKSTENNTKNK